MGSLSAGAYTSNQYLTPKRANRKSSGTSQTCIGPTGKVFLLTAPAAYLQGRLPAYLHPWRR
jgi:hypothetical protein